MADRMKDLRPAGGVEVNHNDLEMAVQNSPAYMQDFFDKVQEYKKEMQNIKYNITQIEQYHGEALTAISTEQGREATDRLENLMRKTNAMATRLRTQLKDMDNQNKELQRKDPGASDVRIRLNMHRSLLLKFVEHMGQYQEIQTKYKNKYRERVVRQYKIVKPDVTNEEIDAALEGDTTQQPEIFTQQILQGPGHASARNALMDIQEKHRDIIKLEASIAELHQLFLDMSVLVESQGELLDQIEYTVGQSVNYTERAVEELRTASKYQKRMRAKMCCCVITLVIILVIILASIFGTRGNDS